MATDIEQLRVQLTADIRRYDAAMHRSMRTTERTLSSIERRFQQNQSSIARSMNETARSMDRLGQVSRTVLAAALSYGSARGIQEAGRLADAWTQAGNRIASTQEAIGRDIANRDQLADLAVRTRSALEPTIELYTRLERAAAGSGRSQEDMLRITERINQALVAGGASQSERASTIMQLGQGIASGALQGEELRAIRENAPLLAQAIADAMGVSIGALRDLGAEGRITRDVILDAIERADAISSQFAQTQTTLSDATANLRTRLVQYVGSLDQSVGASESVARMLGAIANNLDTVGDGALVTASALAAVFAARGSGALAAALSQQVAAMNRNVQSARAAAAAVLEKRRADLQAAQAQLAAAQAANRNALATTNATEREFARTAVQRQLTLATASAERAQARYNRALDYTSGRALAARGALGALRGTMAFFGGPTGLAVLAVAGGIGAIAANSARAAERASNLESALSLVADAAEGVADAAEMAAEATAALGEVERQRAIQTITQAITDQERALVDLARQRAVLEGSLRREVGPGIGRRDDVAIVSRDPTEQEREALAALEQQADDARESLDLLRAGLNQFSDTEAFQRWRSNRNRGSRLPPSSGDGLTDEERTRLARLRERLQVQRQIDVAEAEGFDKAAELLRRELSLMDRIQRYEEARLENARDLAVADEARINAAQDAAAAKEREADAYERAVDLAETQLQHELALAQALGDDSRVRQLERELAVRERIAELTAGGTDPGKAGFIANREADELMLAERQGEFRETFRRTFSDGVLAALQQDEDVFARWVRDNATRGLEQALNRLADHLFNLFSQLGQGGKSGGGGLGGWISNLIMGGRSSPPAIGKSPAAIAAAQVASAALPPVFSTPLPAAASPASAQITVNEFHLHAEGAVMTEELMANLEAKVAAGDATTLATVQGAAARQTRAAPYRLR